MDKLDLSKIENKFYHSKWNKILRKNNQDEISYLNNVIDDAINKNEIEYNTKYYSCAKFIRDTGNYKFKKIQKYKYYVQTFEDEFDKTYISNIYEKCVCINSNKLHYNNHNHYNIYYNDVSGSVIENCTNNCCKLYKKNYNFNIKWI